LRTQARNLRTLGLGAVTALALAAIPAAPAGATVICPPGTTDPNYCTHHLRLFAFVFIEDGQIDIFAYVTDPHLTVTLYKDGDLVKTLYDNPNATGLIHVGLPEPTDPGHYMIKVLATAGNQTKTRTFKFHVKQKHLHPYHHG
jgi:hypothetical protein